MSEKEKMWKDIGYLQGFYDGQLVEIKKQIAYEKMTKEQKYSFNLREFFRFTFNPIP